jgi:uncharacterized protein
MNGLFLATFAASIAGSLHCIGMCGPFAGMAATGGWRSQLAYHSARLMVYLSLGSLSGLLGQAINQTSAMAGLGHGAAIASGLLMIGWGILGLRTGKAKGTEGTKKPFLGEALVRIHRRPPLLRSALLGLSTTILPCGWLYTFVAGAAATGNATFGALWMLAFWLGTLPAMLIAGASLQRIRRFIGPRWVFVMPSVFIALGLYTLTQRHMLPSQTEGCPHHAVRP